MEENSRSTIHSFMEDVRWGSESILLRVDDSREDAPPYVCRIPKRFCVLSPLLNEFALQEWSLALEEEEEDEAVAEDTTDISLANPLRMVSPFSLYMLIEGMKCQFEDNPMEATRFPDLPQPLEHNRFEELVPACFQTFMQEWIIKEDSDMAGLERLIECLLAAEFLEYKDMQKALSIKLACLMMYKTPDENAKQFGEETGLVFSLEEETHILQKHSWLTSDSRQV